MRGKDQVDIVILNWNRPDLTETCVCSILGTRKPEKHRIILVDNGSDRHIKDTVAVARLLNKSDGFIFLDKNYGFAQGMNMGMCLSRPGSDVIVINNDCLATPGWIEALQVARDAIFEQGGAVGILSPMTERCCRSFLCRQHAYDAPPFRVEQPIPAVCWYIVRDAMDEVGHFDTRYEYGCGEDFDYCNQMSANGYEIWAVPRAFVRHLGSQTIRTVKDDGFHKRNGELYHRKWGFSL